MVFKQVVIVALAAAIAHVLATKQRIRRHVLKDRQTLLYSPFARHSATLVKVPAGTDVGALCASLSRALLAAGAGIVYAGRSVTTLVQSAQLPEVAWDAVLIFQHSSRTAAVDAFASPSVREALAGLERSYSLLMHRPLLLSLLWPLALTIPKLLKAFLGPVGAPFTLSPTLATPASGGVPEMREKLLPEIQAGFVKLDKDGRTEALDAAVVVFNLLRAHDDPEISRKNTIYGAKMMRMLGEVDGGIQHFASVQLLEGEDPTIPKPWINAALVYYPGRRFFWDLLQSTFMDNVGKDKKEGDTLAIATVPMDLE